MTCDHLMTVSCVSHPAPPLPPQVATQAASLSDSTQGVKLVRYTTQKLTMLAPQVVSAAETLSVDPSNKSAQENMAAFKDLWEETVESLTDAVDIIVPVQVFMAVTGVCVCVCVCVCVFVCLLCVGVWVWVCVGVYVCVCVCVCVCCVRVGVCGCGCGCGCVGVGVYVALDMFLV